MTHFSSITFFLSLFLLTFLSITQASLSAKSPPTPHTTTRTTQEVMSTTTTTTPQPKSSKLINKKWTLSARPDDVFDASKHAKLVTEEIDLDNIIETTTDPSKITTGDGTAIHPDEVLVQVEILSVDAFIRTMLDEGAYHGSVSLGQTIPALGTGTILHAGSQSHFRKGDSVVGMMGAQSIAKLKSSSLQKRMNLPGVKPSASLGQLGVTGLTAYIGTFCVTKGPRKRETVVVSAASGATGSVVAQLAKLTGARVVGIAGGPHKTKYLREELSLDAVVDYKDTNAKSIGTQLSETCPDGIDFFYDNVGGEILDAVLERINLNARIVICGGISQYSGNLNKGKVRGPSNYLKLAEKSASMVGFALMNETKAHPLAFLYLLYYYYRGYVVLKEHVEDGVESFPGALMKMFDGGHCGRLLVDVSGILKKDESSKEKHE